MISMKSFSQKEGAVTKSPVISAGRRTGLAAHALAPPGIPNPQFIPFRITGIEEA